jgi:hypothetical protein
MAAKPIDKSVTEGILIDWRIGRMSQRDIANKHKVSAALVNKTCKGIPQDVAAIVNTGIQYEQALSDHGERMVNAVQDVVHDAVRNKRFFDNAHVLVAQVTVKKVNTEGEAASFQDLNAAANTITKAREGVMGKTPDTVINNSNASQTVIQYTPEQMRKVNQDLENAC